MSLLPLAAQTSPIPGSPSIILPRFSPWSHRRARGPPLQRLPRDQDAFALASHRKAWPRRLPAVLPMNSFPYRHHCHSRRECRQAHRYRITFPPTKVRAPTPRSKLLPNSNRLHAEGTVTAGNSSQTSDGAAATILMEAAHARELGIHPIGRLLAYAATGCLPRRWAWARFRHSQVLRIAGFTSPTSAHRTQRGLCRAGAGRHHELGLDPRASMSTEEPSPSATRSLHRFQAHRNPARRDAPRQLHYGMVTCASAAAWRGRHLRAARLTQHSELTNFAGNSIWEPVDKL